MITTMYKTTNPFLIERYKQALSVHEDWLSHTKILCINSGFYKFIGMDFMIPELLFSSGFKTVSPHEFDIVSKSGHIYKFKEDISLGNSLYNQFQSICDEAKSKLDIPGKYGTCKKHNFSHAVSNFLNVDASEKQCSLETHSQVWLINNTLYLSYPILLTQFNPNEEHLANMQWKEISASEFQRAYIHGLDNVG